MKRVELKRQRTGHRFARALFALAALILVIGPPLDSVAHAASQAVEAGNASPALQVLSAFDMIDDVLDHLPGEPAGAQQQVLGAAVWPDERVDIAAAQPLGSLAWRIPEDPPLPSLTPGGQDPPPRT